MSKDGDSIPSIREAIILRIQPGDIVALRLDRPAHQDAIRNLQEGFKQFLLDSGRGEIPFCILVDGIEPIVIRPDADV